MASLVSSRLVDNLRGTLKVIAHQTCAPFLRPQRQYFGCLFHVMHTLPFLLTITWKDWSLDSVSTYVVHALLEQVLLSWRRKYWLTVRKVISGSVDRYQVSTSIARTAPN